MTSHTCKTKKLKVHKSSGKLKEKKQMDTTSFHAENGNYLRVFILIFITVPYHFVETKVGDILCEKIFVAKADPLKRITLADLRQCINAGA